MTFTVEIKDHDKLDTGAAELEIFLDRDALADLVKQLSFLEAPGDHAHFMTPAWGGNELSEEVRRRGNSILHHLRISLIE
ncbi:MAG: Imm32 family immunity protein [Holophagales bacterium]|nr:Imm32 family immunity protein [Holophagales bacterium]